MLLENLTKFYTALNICISHWFSGPVFA
uniref:Uncharacterized protein n=1 Tax=Anguilla anguilla TaxID=7936 RepID=A0A0E9QVC8_ANGAN